MSFPVKSDREKCWKSRDDLWSCLDKAAGGTVVGTTSEQDAKNMASVCSQFRSIYESSCPQQWVKHFDRKRAYLKFKDKIQKDGYEPPERLSPS